MSESICVKCDRMRQETDSFGTPCFPTCAIPVRVYDNVNGISYKSYPRCDVKNRDGDCKGFKELVETTQAYRWGSMCLMEKIYTCLALASVTFLGLVFIYVLYITVKTLIGGAP